MTKKTNAKKNPAPRVRVVTVILVDDGGPNQVSDNDLIQSLKIGLPGGKDASLRLISATMKTIEITEDSKGNVNKS